MTTDRRLTSAVTDLLDGAHQVEPDRLTALIETTAATLGASLCRIWLVDHQQRILVPLTTGDDVEPAAVERTIAGRAFASCALVEVAGDAEALHLWFPLVDGVNRIGVLEIDIDHPTPEAREAFRHLATLATSEIIARGQYTDAFTVARRTQTMNLAAELQWQTLPPTSFATRDVTVAGMLEPAYHVGGDIFDYAYNDGGLHVGIFDAVGHGLDASMLSTLALGAYRNRRRGGDELGGIGISIDEVITNHGQTDDYVTGQLAHLDVTTGVLRWLNAGHPLPLLIRHGRVVGPMLCPPRPPFGLGYLLPEAGARMAEDQLEPGDAVLMFTDGIVEARRTSGTDFGLERLIDFMDRAFAADMSPSETLRRLSHAVLDFHSSALQDDATTLLIAWHPQR
jgi:serine phosphatase RsbU (regulator of sigma subunit)